jgi:hypothetical protein
MNRDELERKLREIITGCTSADGSCADCHCTGVAAVYRAMIAVDAYTVTLGLLPDELPTMELWNAEKVAEYAGQSSNAAARSWLSRNGIQRCGTQANRDSGRPESVYPAQEVRAATVRKLMK